MPSEEAVVTEYRERCSHLRDQSRSIIDLLKYSDLKVTYYLIVANLLTVVAGYFLHGDLYEILTGKARVWEMIKTLVEIIVFCYGFLLLWLMRLCMEALRLRPIYIDPSANRMKMLERIAEHPVVYWDLLGKNYLEDIEKNTDVLKEKNLCLQRIGMLMELLLVLGIVLLLIVLVLVR